uniref:flavin reductase family protein n=1 Tax=Ningiella ruwaisensis TaxID=2364274 RepID=UPI0015D19E0A|nr:flavin reductase [Ningiella ruwaisensis]
MSLTNSECVYSSESIQHMEKFERANFVNSLSGFKSANLIGTKSKNGITNLAIVSSVFHVGANPPLIGMLMRPHTVARDTLQNIKDTGYFTINHVNADIVKEAHLSSARFDSDKSEFEATGLTEQYSTRLEAPYVSQSHIKIGVKLKDIQLIELNKTELVIGEIVEVVTANNYKADDGYINIEAAGSIAVSSLDGYHTTSRIARFAYAKAGEEVRELEE